MVDDWIAHTPKDIILRNFGLPANSTAFDKVPSPNPYITNATVGDITIDSPFGSLEDSTDSWVYYGSKVAPTHEIPGGGNVRIIDSHNFPIAKTIATSIVTLKPGALRELHWHPNAEEWLFFSQGTARVSVFMGGAAARTFDFTAGDTAVMPDNSGHYVENTGDEDLVWIELYKSDRVADISLTQWLALTPVELVSQILKVDASVVANLKKEKQLILPAVSN
jgi:oxalate decarboxylase family bicupin protein